VADAGDRLLGTVTDGDVRRGKLRGLGLDAPAAEVMQRRPATIGRDRDRAAALALMRRRRIRCVPVVDGEGRIVGLETEADPLAEVAGESWVVLMAGGLGTRLAPLTDTVPKPLLPVGGRPLAEDIVETLARQGFTRIFLSVNYRAEMFHAHFGDGGRWGVRIDYLLEEQKLGTAGALSPLPEPPTAPLLVMNADVLTALDFRQLLAFHRARGAVATMCVREFNLQVPLRRGADRRRAADRHVGEADAQLPRQRRHLRPVAGRHRLGAVGPALRHDAALRDPAGRGRQPRRLPPPGVLARHRAARRPGAGARRVRPDLWRGMTSAALRALVLGHGSIGARHARLLRAEGHDVAVVSRRAVDWAPLHPGLAAGLAAHRPDYVVIASETAAHGADLAALAAALAGERVLTVEATVGQWLPDWRPGTDHRLSYPAHAGRGGGALRDLSHELDLLLWLFGPWRRRAALGGRLSGVTVDSDDAWAVLVEFASGAVATLQMNYLHRPGRRGLTVDTAGRTLAADPGAGTLAVDGAAERFAAERDDSYRLQHRAVLSGLPGPCTGAEGLAVLALAAAIERAAAERAWVHASEER